MDAEHKELSIREFVRDAGSLLRQLETSDEPLLLTLEGGGRIVVQNADAYQKLLDDLEDAEAHEGIRRGLDDVKHGRHRPAAEALEEIRRRNNIPRTK